MKKRQRAVVIVVQMTNLRKNAEKNFVTDVSHERNVKATKGNAIFMKPARDVMTARQRNIENVVESKR